MKTIKYILYSDKERSLFLLKLIIISLPFSLIINNGLIIAYALNIIISYKNVPFKKSLSKGYILLIGSFPFLMSSIGLIYGANFGLGWFELEKSLSLIIFPILFVFSPVYQKDQIDSIYNTFICVCIVILIYSLGVSAWMVIQNESFVDVARLGDREYYYITYEYLAGVIDMSPIYLSIYFNLAIVFLINKILQSKKHLAWYIVLIVLFSVYIILLLSKMGIIIWLLIILSSVIISYMKKLISLRSLSLIGVGFLFSMVLIFTFKPIRNRITQIDYINYDLTEGHIGYWNGATMRLAIWSCAMEIINDNILIGVGTGNESHELLSVYKNKKFKLGVLLNYNAHNQYLQYAIRFGVLGVLLFILSNIIFPLHLAFRHRNLILAYIIFIYAASFLTESILERQQGVVLYSLFSSLLISTIIQIKK